MPEVIRGVGCVLAVVGCVGLMPGVVYAQTTRLIMEASVDGAQTWSSEVTPTAGVPVYFRLRAQLVGATALGFAGAVYQPVLSNWNSGVDVVVPFTFPGLDSFGEPTTETAYNGRQVAPSPPANTGRLFPFGGNGQGVSSGSGLITAFEDPGNVLRFAGSKNSTPTTNVAWGIASSQYALGSVGFQSSLDVVLFRYAVALGTLSSEDRVATIVHVARGDVRWYLDNKGTVALEAPVEIVPARVVPGPGVVSMAVVAGLVAGRRGRGR